MEERIKMLRLQGKSQNEIAKELGITRDKVRYWCKKYNLGGEIVSNQFGLAIDRERNYRENFNRHYKCKFEYVSGYVNNISSVYIRCLVCGHIEERNASSLRNQKNIICDNCNELKRERQSLVNLLMGICNNEVKKNMQLVKQEMRLKELKSKCAECGKVFIGSSKGMKYCSIECTNKRNNRVKEIRRRKKLKENGTIHWDITLDRLTKRDKNKCHICGGKCNKDDYVLDKSNNFIVGRNYPSIDHVLPISKGGTHTWDNIRLAHHYCNTIKSNNDTFDNGTGQMKMII